MFRGIHIERNSHTCRIMIYNLRVSVGSIEELDLVFFSTSKTGLFKIILIRDKRNEMFSAVLGNVYWETDCHVVLRHCWLSSKEQYSDSTVCQILHHSSWWGKNHNTLKTHSEYHPCACHVHFTENWTDISPHKQPKFNNHSLKVFVCPENKF